MKWERKTINELCEIKGGKRLPKNHELIEVETNHPYIRARDIGNGIIDFSKPVYLQENTFNFISRYTVKADDIVLTIVGANIGDVGLIPKHLDGANLTENAVKLTSFNENCHFKYLLYYFLLPGKKKQLEQVAAGSAQGKLGLYKIKDIEVPIPPLPTQRKIASILSAYDDLIENNLKRIKLLEEKAQLYYKIEFAEYQFGDKEPQNLPKGWVIKTIGDIHGKLESGSRPKGGIDKELKEGIASVGAENVIGLGKYNYQSEKLITEAFYENMNRGKIENKDILIYKDGAYIGKTTLFQDDFPHEKCCVNEHVFLLRSKNELYQNYLFFTLYQKLYFDKMQQLNANAAQPGINQESLKSLRILWPSQNIIEEFNDKVESLMKLIFVLAKQNTKLREARDILLPKLMSGQIEV